MSAHICLALSMSYFLAFKKLQFQDGTNSTAVKILQLTWMVPQFTLLSYFQKQNLQGDNYNPGGKKDVETLNGC
jgi:hypothetical protein